MESLDSPGEVKMDVRIQSIAFKMAKIFNQRLEAAPLARDARHVDFNIEYLEPSFFVLTVINFL